MFWIFLNWTSRGVKRGLTQFHTQFTHVSTQCWALNRTQKKSRENCFENVVSDFEPNCLICLAKYFEKKGDFKFLRFICFYFFAFFFKVTLWTNIAFLSQIWNNIYKTAFLKLFFLFAIQSSKLSRNMHKVRVKLRNAPICPLEVQFSKILFFKNILLSHLKC